MGGAAAGGLWFPVCPPLTHTHTPLPHHIHNPCLKNERGMEGEKEQRKTAALTKLCQNGSGKEQGRDRNGEENEVGFNQNMTKLQLTSNMGRGRGVESHSG